MKKHQYKISQFATNFTLTFSQIITFEVSNVYHCQQPQYSTVSVKWVCMYTAGSMYTWDMFFQKKPPQLRGLEPHPPTLQGCFLYRNSHGAADTAYTGACGVEGIHQCMQGYIIIVNINIKFFGNYFHFKQLTKY